MPVYIATKRSKKDIKLVSKSELDLMTTFDYPLYRCKYYGDMYDFFSGYFKSVFSNRSFGRLGDLIYLASTGKFYQLPDPSYRVIDGSDISDMGYAETTAYYTPDTSDVIPISSITTENGFVLKGEAWLDGAYNFLSHKDVEFDFVGC